MMLVVSTVLMLLCCPAVLSTASRPAGDDGREAEEAAESAQIIVAATAAARALTNAVRGHAAALMQQDQDTGVDQSTAQRQREKVLHVTLAEIQKRSLAFGAGSALFEHSSYGLEHSENESLPECANETISKSMHGEKMKTFIGQCSAHIDELTRLAVAANETNRAISADATSNEVEKMRRVMSHVPPLAEHSCALTSCMMKHARQAKPSWLSDEGYSMWCEDNEPQWQNGLLHSIGMRQLGQLAELLSRGNDLEHRQMSAVITATLSYIPPCRICNVALIGHVEEHVAKNLE